MEPSDSLPDLPEPPGAPGELVVQNGRLSGARRPLSMPMTLIGRSSGCDIRLNVEGVSGLHCAIFDDPLGPILRDLDSESGTQVNGRPIVMHRLDNGDVIDVGPFQFSFSSTSPPATAEIANSTAVFERERDALRIQAAAVAAQQAALVEEEGRLLQRSLALERQETQLAGHLEERQSQLDELDQQLRRQRADFEQERSGALQSIQEQQADLEQTRAEVDQEHLKAKKERQRLVELRRRLKKRWKRHWQQKETLLKNRDHELLRSQQKLENDRARVTAFSERINSELELGRLQLREEWQHLGLAQQRWEDTLNQQCDEHQRQMQELERRSALVAEEVRLLAEREQTWGQHHARLARESEGLEARIQNQRSRLEKLESEANKHEARLNGRPVGEPLVAPPPTAAEPAVAVDVWPVDLREIAEKLSDQRRHLAEQWQRLLEVQDRWEQDRTAALAEMEAMAARLAERDGELRAAAGVIDAARDEGLRRQEELAQRRHSLEGWQSRLAVQEADWQTRRELLLADLESRERLLAVRGQHLEEVHRRRNARRRDEIAALKSAQASCDEARRQYSSLYQECEQLREALERQERKLSSRELALERYRQETVSQSGDSARADSRLHRLARRESARLESEAADLDELRNRLRQERERLDDESERLRQVEEDLQERYGEWLARIAEMESRSAAAEEEEERRRQEVRRLRVIEALNERELRRLRDEIERLARTMIEEADEPSEANQAA
jgi:hypothetical protein